MAARAGKSLLSELDQLRNNFVSLISHDLKTPIAKIQAICDRLLSGSISEDVKDKESWEPAQEKRGTSSLHSKHFANFAA